LETREERAAGSRQQCGRSSILVEDGGLVDYIKIEQFPDILVGVIIEQLSFRNSQGRQSQNERPGRARVRRHEQAGAVHPPQSPRRLVEKGVSKGYHRICKVFEDTWHCF
jgi:hypothetical protein